MEEWGGGGPELLDHPVLLLHHELQGLHLVPQEPPLGLGAGGGGARGPAGAPPLLPAWGRNKRRVRRRGGGVLEDKVGNLLLHLEDTQY